MRCRRASAHQHHRDDGESERGACHGLQLPQSDEVQRGCHESCRAGSRVAAQVVMQLNIRDRLHELTAKSRALAAIYPRAAWAILAVCAAVVIAAVSVTARFVIHLRDGLPDETAVTRIGEMDQATAVYDGSDALAFTIFKEQRIDVPLDQVSPNVIHALLAIEDQH